MSADDLTEGKAFVRIDSNAGSASVSTDITDPPSAELSHRFATAFERLRANVALVVKGKEDVITLTLICLLSEGHLLIEDVPGVGKTSLAKALAASVDAPFGRIQFTPDVLPSDVIGVNVWDDRAHEFDFRPGALFASIVLVDEINRASPKTQAALLEAMQERQVTTDRVTRSLGKPFMVIATQNPIEHEGTYPLPESQLDRFLMRVSVGYPDSAAAVEVLTVHNGEAPVSVDPVVSVAELLTMTEAVRSVHVAGVLRNYIVAIAEASRNHPRVALGISPRATLNLQRVAQAHALSTGRAYVVPDDVKATAPSVLGHRIRLSPEAQLAGMTPLSLLSEVIDSVAVPTRSSEKTIIK